MTGHVQVLEGLGVPPRKASGSRFPLQVLGWITSLWAFRCNRSREMRLVCLNQCWTYVKVNSETSGSN